MSSWTADGHAGDLMPAATRLGLKALVHRAGLLPAAMAVRRGLRWATDPRARDAARTAGREFASLRRQAGEILGARLCGDRPRGRALLVSLGSVSPVGIELALLKGLELAGLEPVVLMHRHPALSRYYRLAGVRRMLTWDEVSPPVSARRAAAALAQCRTLEDLLAWEPGGVRLGRLAASTALRQLRTGSLNLQQPTVQAALRQALGEGLASARGAQETLRRVRPEAVLLVDRGYLPQGPLMDHALNTGVDCVTWNTAHKSGALMLKRFTPGSRDQHPASLSEASWSRLRALPWTSARRTSLRDEFEGTYRRGDWYSEVGTQFHTKLIDPATLRRRLGVTEGQKLAVVFPHILWDETFLMGRDLFRNYEEAFAETVRAACRNPRVRWVIRVHPANLVKDRRDGVRGRSAELDTLRVLGPLPPHVTLLGPESDISTYALYAIMDYALTVRGTVGIEAAAFGIPVLTAGTGRYDRRGFTVDSDSREDYLERLARIDELPPLSAAQRELAERFAYGVFVARPWRLHSVQLEFQRDALATLHTRLAVADAAGWCRAEDLNAFARWIGTLQEADYLHVPALADEGTEAPVELAGGVTV